jgi:hypothetical protein
MSKLYSKPLWRDTLLRVRPKGGGYIDDDWHVSHWYSEPWRIGMTFNSCTVSGVLNHSIDVISLTLAQCD